MQALFPTTEPTRRKNVIRITKLIMAPTGTYNKIYSRPYSSYVDGESLDNIVSRLEQATDSVTGTLLSGLASGIITPSATPGAEIAIPYGWDERRVRFMMEVEVTVSTGSSFTYYFQGYTSHLGVTDTGSIDPTMQFIINSFIRVNRVTQMTQFGPQISDTITDSAHIVDGQIHYDLNSGQEVYGMRPCDIYTGIQSAYLEQAYSYTNSGDGFLDTRVGLNHETIRSSRKNNIPSAYLASVFNEYLTAVQMTEYGLSQQEILDKSRQLTFEPSVNENVFIKAISNVRGIPSSTTFCMNDLMAIDPNVGYVTKYLSLGSQTAKVLLSAGQTAYWNSSDLETHTATILMNAIPSLMMELMLRKAWFRSTNSDSGGVMSTVLMEGESVTTADMSKHFELFKRRLEREIMFDITHGNQRIYMLDMKVDLFGDSILYLSLDGGAMIPYGFPTFSDALGTPIITHHKDDFFTLTNDMESIMNSISSTKNTFGLDFDVGQVSSYI